MDDNGTQCIEIEDVETTVFGDRRCSKEQKKTASKNCT
jgi:hypothetical protein